MARAAAVVGVVLGAVALAGGAWAASGVKDKSRPRSPTVSLQWVGDIALSTQRGLPPGGLVSALAPVSGFLRDADLTLGNLEGTLSAGGPSKCGRGGAGTCFAFQAPPVEAFGLRRLGFGLVNQANNHSLDFGASGRSQTVAALRRAGIAYTGLPSQITYRSVKGVRMAFLGFAPYSFDSNLLDISGARAMVARARRHAQVVVIFIHAGAEGADALHTPFGNQFFLGENRGDARGFAHAVINAGASVVLGSGPHVIRGVERYRGHLIAYSLGNFVGYHTLAGGGVLSDSGIIRVTLDARGRLQTARWISIRLVDGLPRPDRGDAAARLVARLSREDFPSGHYRIPPDGRFIL